MLIKVKVISRSHKQGVIKKAIDSYEVKVKARPQYGEANKEARKILAEYFEIPEHQIRIIRGFRQTNKIFSFTSAAPSGRKDS